MAERLKREEEERQARRKRVEAIMKRTRNNPANSTNKVSHRICFYRILFFKFSYF